MTAPVDATTTEAWARLTELAAGFEPDLRRLVRGRPRPGRRG